MTEPTVTLGTDPATPPVADGASGEQPTPATEAVADKYEALLGRLTSMEDRIRESDARASAAESRLTQLMNDNLGDSRSTSAPGNVESDMQAAENILFATANNPNATPEERAMATYLLGRSAHQRELDAAIRQIAPLISLPESERTAVVKIRQEAAKRGENLSMETAQTIVSLQRKLEEAQAKPAPPPPTPNRVVPTSAPIAAGGQPTLTYSQFSAEWANASPQRKSELRSLEAAGRVVPG